MNNIFSSKRFGMLIRRQWMEFGKVYLMSLTIIAGVFIAFYAYNIYEALNKSAYKDMGVSLTFRFYVFVFVGLLFITIISSSYFNHLGQKSKAIFELMLPATKLEKYMVAIFYTVIVTTFSYVFIFYLVDLAFVYYLRSNYTSTSTYVDPQTGLTVVNDQLQYFFRRDFATQLYYTLFTPYLLSSLFLLGSIAFSRFQYIKTAILITLYALVYLLLANVLGRLLTADTMVVGSGQFMEDEMVVLTYTCILGIVLTFVIWFIGYLRLKEKEV